MEGLTRTAVSSFSYYPAENLVEYKWPPDEAGEYYMLQEQVSEYLGVTSFKRKYPGTRRGLRGRLDLTANRPSSLLELLTNQCLRVDYDMFPPLLAAEFPLLLSSSPSLYVGLFFCFVNWFKSKIRKINSWENF